MKIKFAKSIFTGGIFPGRNALEINIDKYGVRTPYDELVTKAKYYNYVVLSGEGLYNVDKTDKFLRGVKKDNPSCKFEIHTSGLYHPRGAKNVNDIKFILNIKLSEGMNNEKYTVRNIKFFNDYQSCFVFDLSKEDIVQVKMFVEEFGIKKSDVYLTYKGKIEQSDLNILLKKSIDLNCNFKIDYNILFWEDKNEKSN